MSGIKFESPPTLTTDTDVPEEERTSRKQSEIPWSKEEELFYKTGSVYESGDTTLEHVYRSTGISDPRVANAAAFWGINYYKSGNYTATPHIGYGHIFFTRPRLNLTTHNINRIRTFASLLNKDKGSIGSITRSYLDPVYHSDTSNPDRTNLVDPRNPFISILSNQCISASGFPEVPVDVYTSRPGLHGEVYSLADGHPVNYGSYTINCNFANIKNDYINYLFHIWTQYAMYTHNGQVMPYKDDWLYNRVNYNTRIYRLVTDISGEYVVDYACCGAAIPVNSNKASLYDFERDKIFNENIKESSIQFHCNGFWMMDPIVLRAFNETVKMFCPEMVSSVRSKHYVELTPDVKPFFQHAALPYIDLRTAKLGWYVKKDFYESEMKILSRGTSIWR